MKQLILDTGANQGGHRRSLNDYWTLMESINDIAQAFTDSMGFDSGGTTVLSGLDYNVSSGNYTLQKGWLTFQGKPVFVPTSTGTAATGEQVYIEIEDNPIFPANDPVNYADSTQNSVHREKIGVVKTAAIIPPGIDYVLPNQLNKGRWRNDLFAVSGLSGTTGCQINFLIKGKTAHIKVVLNNVTASGGTFINVTLPDYLQSKSRELFPVTCVRNTVALSSDANFLCDISGPNLIIRNDTGNPFSTLQPGLYTFLFSYTYELS